DLYNYMKPELWTDPEMVRLMECVETYADPEAEGEKMNLATVRIDLKDGRSLNAVETYPKGSPKNPATQEDLAKKLRTLASTVLSSQGIDKLISTVEDLENLGDVSRLAELLVRSPK